MVSGLISIAIRTVVIYAVIIAAYRFMGKRELGELEPSELVVAVLISEMAAQPMQSVETPLIYGLLPTLLLLSLEVLMSAASLKSPRFSALVFGKPSVIIEKGRINQAEMRRNRLTPDELSITLRKKSITDIGSVKYAILETDGTLSILPYHAQSPATPKDLGAEVPEAGYPVIVINDGHTMSENLRATGHDERWLKKQLRARGVSEASDVYFMSIDETGAVYFAPKDAPGKAARR